MTVRTGTIGARTVRLGPVAGDMVAILSGLKRGDVIVSKGVAFVEHGEAVNLIGAGPRRFAQ